MKAAFETRAIENTLLKLLAFCRARNWSGYDPYDALNSRIFQKIPVLDSRLPRIVLTQTLKRSPINVRRLLLVPETQNPKGLALILSGLLNLRDDLLPDRGHLCDYMVKRLVQLRSPGVTYWCWGYSFPWQTRQNIVPAGAPNLVCTTFVANSLLDFYEQAGNQELLNKAISAAEYILNELYWENGSEAGFSYPLRSLHVQVYNANFLAAALLCRIYRHTGLRTFRDPALKATRYSVRRQNADGSWYYGAAPFQMWIDNFHTGFNLSALLTIAKELETEEFEPSIRRGFDFYREHFFRNDGAPRYFHDRTYPIDAHSAAQSILTLLEFHDFDKTCFEQAISVLCWTMQHLWDDRGFFYYRVHRFGTIRMPYMRWSEAWMFLALSALLMYSRRSAEDKDCVLSQMQPAAVHDQL